MKFDIDAFARQEFGVNCQTIEEANDFLALLHHNGFKWQSGEYLTERNLWSDYGQRTVYISSGIKSRRICYGSTSSISKTIIPYKALFNNVEIDATSLVALLF